MFNIAKDQSTSYNAPTNVAPATAWARVGQYVFRLVCVYQKMCEKSETRKSELLQRQRK